MFLEHHGRPLGRGDVAALDRVEARQRAKQRGLAAATLAEQGDELTLLDAQVEALYHPAAAIGPHEAMDRHGDVARGREWGGHDAPSSRIVRVPGEQPSLQQASNGIRHHAD